MASGNIRVKLFHPEGTEVLSFSKSSLTLGRAGHCDVVLDHATVAAEHARVWFEGGRIWVQDLGGESGTTLNGTRLPALKPMLIRDVDHLKAGECAVALGLEFNAVRSPIVKSIAKPASSAAVSPSSGVSSLAAAPAPSAATATGGPSENELLRRKEELGTLAKELADLKWQRQMMSLERASEEAMSQQLQSLKNEIQTVHEQKEKWAETLRQVELDRQKAVADLNQQTQDLISHTRAQLAEEQRQLHLTFEQSKNQLVEALRRDTQELSVKKLKEWSTRPLSQDMILDWEQSLLEIYRKVLLPNAQPAARAEGPAVIERRSGERKSRRRNEQVKKNESTLLNRRFVRFGLAVGLTSLVGAIGWFWSFKKTSSKDLVAKSPRSERSTSSVEKTTRVQTKGFKRSYAENVQSTLHFVSAEQNADFRESWASELKKVATEDWGLGAEKVKSILALEKTMITDLSRLLEQRESVGDADISKRMQERESQFEKDAQSVLGAKISYEKFYKAKKSFFNQNQAYISDASR